MPDGKDRSPALGFAEGFGVGAVAWIVLWQAYLQWERTLHTAQSTFEFRRPGFVWAQLLFVLAGGLVGLIIVLALRGSPRRRVWTLAGGAIPPLSLVVGFWYWLLSEGGAPLHGSVLSFTLATGTQAAAAVIGGTLVAVAVAPFLRRSGG